ncbi:MAG: metallophosphoesterase [Bilophila wadsworthia]
MRILHLSDFHLRGDGGLSFRVVDTLECLRVVAEHLKTLVQKPDALVITGDLADSGDAHAYSLLHEALAPLSLPVYAVPGNHDRRDRMRELLGNGALPMLPWLRTCAMPWRMARCAWSCWIPCSRVRIPGTALKP